MNIKIITKSFLFIIITALLTSCGGSRHTVNTDNWLDPQGRYVYNSLAWGSSKEETEKALGFKLDAEPADTRSADGRNAEAQRYIQRDSARIVIDNETYLGDTTVVFAEGGLSYITFNFLMSPDISGDVLRALVAELTGIYGEPIIPEGEITVEVPGYESYGWKKDEEQIVTSVGVGKYAVWSPGDEGPKEAVGISIGIAYLS